MSPQTPSDAPPRKLPPEVRRSLVRVHDRTASETDLQRVVIRYAKDHGWRVHHAQRAKVKDGRVLTPTQGNPGYPDLTLARGDQLIFAELKRESGSVSPEQQAWLDMLEGVPGVDVHVWRPRHWPSIRHTLR